MQYSVCSLFPNRPHLSSERETRRQGFKRKVELPPPKAPKKRGAGNKAPADPGHKAEDGRAIHKGGAFYYGVKKRRAAHSSPRSLFRLFEKAKNFASYPRKKA